jgi:hypothetical protein
VNQLMMFDMPAKAVPKNGCPISLALSEATEPVGDYENPQWAAWIAQRAAELRDEHLAALNPNYCGRAGSKMRADSYANLDDWEG